jgi:hypothetical protein
MLADLLPAGLVGLADQVGGGEPLHRLGVGPDRLGGLALGGQAQRERADLGLEYPGVQLLGLRGTRSRWVMVVALFLWPTIRTQRCRRPETSKHQQDREMTRQTVPAAETGHRSETRISRWLNPGRRRTTDRGAGAVPACPPKCLPACGAALRLLPRWLTVPLCTARIEHPAARLWLGVPSRPAGWFTAHG